MFLYIVVIVFLIFFCSGLKVLGSIFSLFFSDLGFLIKLFILGLLLGGLLCVIDVFCLLFVFIFNYSFLVLVIIKLGMFFFFVVWNVSFFLYMLLISFYVGWMYLSIILVFIVLNLVLLSESGSSNILCSWVDMMFS